MLDVVRFSEEEVRRARTESGDLLRASEEEDVAAVGAVVEVTLAGLGGNRCHRLRLPMKQVGTDRIVLVHRRRRVVRLGLVQRHEEGVGIRRRRKEDALPEAVGLSSVDRHIVQRRDDLLPCVPRVDPQRAHAQLTRQSSGHTLGPLQPQSDHGPQILTRGGFLPKGVEPGAVRIEPTPVRPQREEQHPPVGL